MKKFFKLFVVPTALLAMLVVSLINWRPGFALQVLAVFSPELAAELIANWREQVSKDEPEQQQRNLETEVIRIELAGHKYNVPMRYSFAEAIEKRGRWPTAKPGRVEVGALSISVLLPDMKPYYPEDDARWNVRGHGERAEISISNPNYPLDWYHAFRDRIVAGIESESYVKMEDEYGLMLFKRTGALDDTYLPSNEEDELLIRCSNPRDSSDYFPGCSVSSNYHLGATLDYYYARQYLPQWKEIDRKIKTLFDQFEYAAESEFNQEQQ